MMLLVVECPVPVLHPNDLRSEVAGPREGTRFTKLSVAQPFQHLFQPAVFARDLHYPAHVEIARHQIERIKGANGSLKLLEGN